MELTRDNPRILWSVTREIVSIHVTTKVGGRIMFNLTNGKLKQIVVRVAMMSQRYSKRNSFLLLYDKHILGSEMEPRIRSRKSKLSELLAPEK